MNTVQYIIDHQLELTDDDRLKIKTLGRPMPNMTIENVAYSGKKVVRRSFNNSSYDRHPWMCGCDVNKAMFCFPCLLFGKDGVWTKGGITDLKHLSAKVTSHSKSQKHLNSELQLAMLGAVDLRRQLDSKYTATLTRQREKVDKKRFLLSKVVGCVRYWCAQDLPSGRVSPDLSGMSSLSGAIHKYLQDAAVFQGTSKAVQDELLDAMLAVYRDVVTEEVAGASFLAVQADEIRSYTMLTLRYEVKGKVVERYWGFFKTDVDNLSDVILRELENLNVIATPGKLVSQSYDGSTVMSRSKDQVYDEVKKVYPDANYVHSYAHHFVEVVRQSTSKRNKAIETFFSRVDAFYEFFSESSTRLNAFHKIVARKRKKLPFWNKPRDTVNTVFLYKDEIALYLEETVDMCDRESRQVLALSAHLFDQDFTYWLKFFYEVFLQVNILFKNFQKLHDCIFKKKMENRMVLFKNAISKVVKVKRDSVSGEGECTPKRPRLETRDAATDEVCEIITTQLEARLQFTSHIIASQLLNSDKFADYSQVFPDKKLATTADAFPSLQKCKLRAELEVIYSFDDLETVDGLTSMLQLFISNKLTETFSETVTLCRLLATIPTPTTDTGRRFWTLRHAREFLRHSESREGVCALGMLAVEKEYVNTIKHFNRLVIEKFVSAGGGTSCSNLARLRNS